MKPIFFLYFLAGFAYADKTIFINNPADPRIQYTTGDLSDINSPKTWEVQRANPHGGCDTTQMLTERVNDYATFTFNGTGITVEGTIGKRRGIINFTLDGEYRTIVNRTNHNLTCDQAIFYQKNLENRQHTLVATLISKDLNSTDKFDGVLSIQRISYTVPGRSSNTPIIVGASVGCAALLAIVLVTLLLFVRKRRRPNYTSNTSPSQEHTGGPYKPEVDELVATPLVLPSASQIIHPPESDSGSYSTTMPPFQRGGSPFPSPSGRRVSNPQNRDSKTSYLTSQPDHRSSTSRETPSGIDDEGLADRIALRLSDMMRVGAGASPDAPPPTYEPGNGPGPSFGQPLVMTPQSVTSHGQQITDSHLRVASPTRHSSHFGSVDEGNFGPQR